MGKFFRRNHLNCFYEIKKRPLSVSISQIRVIRVLSLTVA